MFTSGRQIFLLRLWEEERSTERFRDLPRGYTAITPHSGSGSLILVAQSARSTEPC